MFELKHEAFIASDIFKKYVRKIGDIDTKLNIRGTYIISKDKR